MRVRFWNPFENEWTNEAALRRLDVNVMSVSWRSASCVYFPGWKISNALPYPVPVGRSHERAFLLVWTRPADDADPLAGSEKELVEVLRRVPTHRQK
ncbi:MAG TPA: hypothetical protein VFC19_29760 [Candidatus Limnocylindrales bacterium]|nr:hypothetical protein [Candidatus Limnocylindrales bacterium]